MEVHGFPPIADPDCDRLVLGSMPGRASLDATQYYAHPRNLFWPFMETLFGVPCDAPYGERVRTLCACGVAVWDVLRRCDRASSLDADIVPGSMVPNDFASFLAAHPRIRRIGFNGAKAADTFTKQVRPELPDAERFELLRLPSTSPANASIPREKKLAAWQAFAARL